MAYNDDDGDEGQEEMRPQFRGEPVEFRPPGDFHIPDPAEPGKPFELVCQFEAKPDGSLCLVMLGDVPIPKPKYKNAPAEKAPDYREYSKGIMDGMQGQSQTEPMM